MEIKKLKNASHPTRYVVVRIILCIVILLAGVLVMAKLSSLKKPPAETVTHERPLRVEGVKTVFEDVDVFIQGYGEAHALDTVAISPEVSGTIVAVHPRLEIGEIIPRGETLFKIDDRTYRTTLEEARATVTQLEAAVQRLQKQYQIDQERQKSIVWNRELARAEYERVKTLYTTRKVGSQSGVDKAEQSYNAASDAADQMASQIALYPIMIKEAESGLASSRARQTLAEINLKRCRVTAPFEGRVKSAGLEAGQFVSPGQNVLTLANDAILEIHVPIDSRDARQWLIFKPETSRNNGAWFTGLEPLPCEIRWTEAPQEHLWEGRLDRVMTFNQQTRTLTVAVRIEATAAGRPVKTALPLVEGMFCSVKIPGKRLENVVRLPRWAVTFDGKVYIADRQSRLQTVPVTVARTEGESVYVSKGLNPGETVITTRLIDPLENALLEVDLTPASF